MRKVKYSLSFTTGAALIRESVLVAKLFVELQDWSEVRFKILENNSFQARTVRTLQKLYGEVSKRLKCLTDEELEVLAYSNDANVRALVWLAICRHYTFVYDFTIEIIVPQYEVARFLLTHEDFDSYFNIKAEWHENLDALTVQTRGKARQVLFKMMKECAIIASNNEILYQFLSRQLVQMLKLSSPNDLRLYPGLEYA